MLEPLRHTLATTKLILASASPRRKEIFQSLGLNVEIIPSDAKENLNKGDYKGNLKDYAVDTSELKADDIFNKLKDSYDTEDLVVVGADTIVVHGGVISEKPKDIDDAFKMLTALSGKSHTVYTGVTILYRKREKDAVKVKFVEGTEVEFDDFTDEVIAAYIATGEPMDKAGGYGIQGKGGSLVRGIKGDYFNVMGFPAHAFSKQLSRLLTKS